jgi:hypothetical protein
MKAPHERPDTDVCDGSPWYDGRASAASSAEASGLRAQCFPFTYLQRFHVEHRCPLAGLLTATQASDLASLIARGIQQRAAAIDRATAVWRGAIVRDAR